MTGCRVYWGSHGCHLERGHRGGHVCGCCECPDHARDHESEGCVALWPYYGWRTWFYGEDVTGRERAWARLRMTVIDMGSAVRRWWWKGRYARE